MRGNDSVIRRMAEFAALTVDGEPVAGVRLDAEVEATAEREMVHTQGVDPLEAIDVGHAGALVIRGALPFELAKRLVAGDFQLHVEIRSEGNPS